MAGTHGNRLPHDLEDSRSSSQGEIIDGKLYRFARPCAIQSELEAAMAEDLRPPFVRGFGGPGGWWILVEPGVALPSAPDLVVPDLGGWRKQTLPRLPTEGHIMTAPDWVCEIHSPEMREYDLLVKLPFYARVGVTHCWNIDLEQRTLTVNRLVQGRWVEVGVFGPNTPVLVEPFDSIELDLPEWWDGTSSDEGRGK